MHVCIYTSIYARLMYVCMYVCMLVCIHVCLHVIFKMSFERCWGELSCLRGELSGGEMFGRIVRGKYPFPTPATVGAWWLIGSFVVFRPKGLGSNPALAATKGPSQVLHSQLPVANRRETPTQYPRCVGSTSE